MEIENSSSMISKIDSKEKQVIRLDKCYFSKLKECPNHEVLNYYYCFLAITEDNGLFRKLCDDNSGNNERSLNWIFMKDLKIVAIEKKQKEKKIVLFLLSKEITDVFENTRCDNLFSKTFKYFFPSNRTSYASVDQKEEKAKYSLISNDLKKECIEMNDFLLLFEEHHYSGFGFNNSDSRLELMKKDCSSMKNFNQIIFSFFFYGKTLKNQMRELDIVKTTKKEDLIKIGMTIDCVYEDEKPIMLKKLDLFEKSSHKGIPINPKDFKRSLSHDYITFERFIKENKKRFRSISNCASKYSKSSSILVNDSKIIFDKNGVIDEEEMKKGEEILEITTKTRKSKVLIKHFYSDYEFFEKVNHVFVDASWINKYMIVPITTMIKIDKNSIPEEEPPYWIYKTVMIFFIEGEVLLENEIKKCSPKGTNDLYNYIFEVVKTKCINLKSVSSDFEAAILNGIDSQKLQRWGCYFHYIQRLRANCSENHYLVSNQCLSILKILPFVNLSIGKHRKRNLDELQKIFAHKPDLEMFKYVRKQYLNNPKVFNRKVVINQSEAEKEIEYFKFTDNASERVFRNLKSSIMKGTKTAIDKQYLIERILHYLKRQKNSYVGGRNRDTKFKFVKSDLGYFFRHGMEEFERRKKLYLDALEQDHLEGIKLVMKTFFKDAFGNYSKIWIEKKKRKRIDKIPIKLQDLDSSFQEYTSSSDHRKTNLYGNFKPNITKTRSNVSKILTKRDRLTTFSAGEKVAFGTKISTLTDEELRGFKRIKIFENDSTKSMSLKLNKTESKLKDIEKLVKLEKERRENERKLRELEKVELERQRKFDQEQRELEKSEFERQRKLDQEQRELEKAYERDLRQKADDEAIKERDLRKREKIEFEERFKKLEQLLWIQINQSVVTQAPSNYYNVQTDEKNNYVNDDLLIDNSSKVENNMNKNDKKEQIQSYNNDYKNIDITKSHIGEKKIKQSLKASLNNLQLARKNK